MNLHNESLVKSLFQLVWADDAVSAQEVHALKTVLLRLGYSLSETICLLDGYLSPASASRCKRPLEETFGPDLPTPQELKYLLMICFSEGSIGPEHLGYIEGLILRLGLSAAELEKLRCEAVRELSA